MIAIIFLIIVVLFLMKLNDIENWDPLLDTIYIPQNPVDYNEVETRRFIRLIGIDQHVKLDRYDNIDRITYKPPTPELGEKKCFLVNCPSWIKNIGCWKCE